ncbi:methylaspartate mutase subunit E [Streptomyces sp. NBC_01217]|uniref:methylaspartate mutase subunit E n=1 Tax=Streptomyces sp. NBC_01217 TaxID=2903779 RepID=UPI002E111FA9|nr:methylaspartate mutase subunit E [Streptomyces sp. NBC_01217]
MGLPTPGTIVLGGIGADAHSVGLTLLKHAITEAGHVVHFMGTQNNLDDFFRRAADADIVMISCMDGHLRHYLKRFPDLVLKCPGIDAFWYAGGNLDVGSSERIRAEARRMGFRRVFPTYVDIPTVLTALAEDLTIRPHAVRGRPAAPAEPVHPGTAPPDQRLTVADLERQRPGVLESWPTGAGARNLEDNAAFLLRQPSFAHAHLPRARAQRPPFLVQPRSGVALAAKQRAAFVALRRAGADVLSYQIDSLTRNNDYRQASDAIAESVERRASALNGFPMVNHGVDALRQIIAEVRTPLQTRHSTRDPRLLAEISCAGGVTGFEGGAITYNIPYFKDYSLAQSLRRWQYVDRLVGLYREKFGVVIDREFFGTLTAVLVPPSLAIVVNLIEAMLAASQGVGSVSLGYAEQGNRSQDIAAIRVLSELGQKYLANLGYPGIQVNTVFHQHMAAFPADRARATQLIMASAATGRLSGASRLIVKTPVEATTIPSVTDNQEGLQLSRTGAIEADGIEVDERTVREETTVLRAEVDQILESVLLAGDGSLTDGVVKAFALGYLDVPFSPSVYNRGEVLTARDVSGAVRYLNTGRLRFSSDVVEFHRSRMSERRRTEQPPVRSEWQLVERDVLRVPSGRYRRWPLDG